MPTKRPAAKLPTRGKPKEGASSPKPGKRLNEAKQKIAKKLEKDRRGDKGATATKSLRNRKDRGRETKVKAREDAGRSTKSRAKAKADKGGRSQEKASRRK